MAIQKITVKELPALLGRVPVFDVRSPGEYTHAHIPEAHSLPLFTDEERAVIGTSYKKRGRQKAVLEGLDFFAPRMKPLIAQVEKTLKTMGGPQPLVVHCWRGGMRSGAVAWLLDLYGFEVKLLVGGYKSYRRWALEQFTQPYELRVLGGFTGSAKTETLQALNKKGVPVIDLEGLAHHKGSAFGGIGQPPQPTQEMFENRLALALFEYRDRAFWIEDESQRIGALNIPHPLWATIRQRPVCFMEIPFEERLGFIEKQYGTLDREKLMEAVSRIQKRFGPNETKITLAYLSEGRIRDAFRELLRYYDREYYKSLHKREKPETRIQTFSYPRVDPETNAQNIVSI